MTDRVLVVDGDAALASQIKDHLVQRGHDVRTAPDGVEGLLLARQFHPHVIVLDLLLPKIDGYRFCRYLADDPSLAEIPVIICSALVPEEKQRIEQLGAKAAFAKGPVADLLPKLAGAVSAILSRNDPALDAEVKLRITSQREMIRELLKQRTHYVEMMNLLPEGVFELDPEGKVIYVNAAACRLLGHNESLMMGKHFSDLFSADLRSRLAGFLKEFPAQGPVTETVFSHQRLLRFRFVPLSSGTLVSLLDASRESGDAGQAIDPAQQLQDFRQELERRLNSMQIIQRLPSEIEYPYGYPEILEAILRLLPALMQTDAAAALVQDENGWNLNIKTEEDAGEENLNWIKTQMLERYTTTTGKPVDPNKLFHHFSGAPAGQGPSIYNVPIQSSLYVLLKLRDRITGLLGCFSFKENAFTSLEQILLDYLVGLISNSVVNLKNLIDSERQKMKAMVESMADGVLMTDQSDEIVIVNEAARKMLHVSRKGDMITTQYLQDILGFYPFHLTKGLIDQPASKRTVQEEIKVFDKTLHSIVAPVSDFERNQIGVVVVLRDITEQKESEERKNEFFSAVSHELRTPLASIGGSLDLVIKNVVGQINDKQRRYLELAKDSCDKLNMVIDDLLDLSKFERGRMEINLEPISIGKLIEEVTEKFQAVAMEKQINLHLKQSAEDISIFGDDNRLVQVMNNLLSNALKFTPTGGEIEVEMFAPRMSPPHIGVSVKDTGPGIQANDLERVFDKFEQVRRSEARKIGGTGLGLAISRSIIEAHKGKIWVESQPGQGARFIFVIPAEKRTTPDTEIETSLNELSGAEEIKVVILTNDEASAYMLKGLLLERKWKVVVCSDPKEGVQTVRQQAPQLVIIDLEQTTPSAEQVVDILTHDPETSPVPVITLQPVNIASDIIQEADKPIDVNQFLHALSQALAGLRRMEKRKKIMVVDDDPNLRMIFRESLEYEKYRVIEAADGAQALELLKKQHPDLILLDIMLPGIDGVKIAEIIKSNISTSQIPIIFLTAKGQTEDKVRALKSGGDDYMVKPIDSTELVARIESLLQRMEKELAASPTTKLPGSVSIEKEINRRLSLNKKFALCYLDLDNLKSFNDVYGYAKADGAIKQTGDLIRETVLKIGTTGDFVGHVAGDDFVFLTLPEFADRICLSIIQKFDQIIPYFYKQQDRERGYIEAEDRYGAWRKFPIMSISIACLTNEDQRFGDHVQIATMAADLKHMAKAIPGSVYIRNGKVVS